jgi:uncharacterized membrane protein (UPF0136 family)
MSILNPPELLERAGGFIIKHRKARKWILIANVVSLGCGLALVAYLTLYGSKEQLDYFHRHTLQFFTILPILTFGSVTMYSIANAKGYIEMELDKLHVERKEITNKIEKEVSPDIFNTIQLSLNQITEYYTINKGQAKSSFGVSIGAIIIGLITILAGIWLHLVKNQNIEVAYIASISGTIL